MYPVVFIAVSEEFEDFRRIAADITTYNLFR